MKDQYDYLVTSEYQTILIRETVIVEFSYLALVVITPGTYG